MGVITDDMRRVVEEQQLGFVATVCPDGTPNLSPKGTTAVCDDDHLVFADIHSPRTVANLRANPAVEINVVDPLTRKGFRFKGAAPDRRRRARSSPPCSTSTAPAARPARSARIVVVKVESAAPLISPAYDDGTSEAAVVARWRATGCSCGTQANSLREQPCRSAAGRNQPNRPSVERDKLIGAKPCAVERDDAVREVAACVQVGQARFSQRFVGQHVRAAQQHAHSAGNLGWGEPVAAAKHPDELAQSRRRERHCLGVLQLRASQLRLPGVVIDQRSDEQVCVSRYLHGAGRPSLAR